MQECLLMQPGGTAWSACLDGLLPRRHVLMIPTNRGIDYCLDSYLLDIRRNINSAKIRQEDIMLAVIEDGCEEIVRHNSDLIKSRKISGELPCPVLHVTPDMVSGFLSALLGNDDSLSALFARKGINYGRIANILSLLAVSFGAEHLHRRDSDTAVNTENGFFCSPLEAELRFFSENASNLSIIGSNYLISSDIDISIFKNNPDCISPLYHLVGMDEKTIEMKMEIPPNGQESTSTSIDGGLWPDMGNIAFRNIFSEYSCPPHGETLGSDYFLMQLAEAAGIPMFLHYRRINHLMGPERSEDTYRLRYYRMLASCIDYFSVYIHLYDIPGMRNGIFSDELAVILDRLADKGYADTELRKQHLLEYAELFFKVGNTLAVKIGSEIRDSIAEIIAVNDKSGREHVILQKNWKKLTEKASLLFSDGIAATEKDLCP